MEGIPDMGHCIRIGISNKKLGRSASHFYRRLGLSAIIKASELQVAGTDLAEPRKTSKGMKVRVHPRLYKHLVRKYEGKVLRDPLDNPVLISRQSCSPIRVGILTSGGDAPGMNAAIYGCVRRARQHRIRVYGICRGFQGLITGGVKELLNKIEGVDSGGTQLLSMRSHAFRTAAGQEAAVRTLLKWKINRLIIVGGGGTFVGALQLCEEFRRYAPDGCELAVACIPGTIDNDIPLIASHGHVSTLGCDSAVQRIVTVIDQVSLTMQSHHRILVVECMGRSSGWLTMMSARATDADFVLLPEAPQAHWQEELVRTVEAAFHSHTRAIMVFVCEGAVDIHGNPISLDDIKAVIEAGLSRTTGASCADILDVRTLRIGHTQRGGPPTAKDRIFGVMSGEAAVEHFVSGSTDLVCTSFSSQGIQLVPLHAVVSGIQQMSSVTDFSLIFGRRDSLFQRIFRDFEELRTARSLWLARRREGPGCDTGPGDGPSTPQRRKRIAILYNGPITAGTGACLNILAQLGTYRGHEMLYFKNGINGLSKPRAVSIPRLRKHQGRLGIEIGRSDKKPKASKIRQAIEDANLDHLIVVGDTKNLPLVREFPNVVLILTEGEGSQEGLGLDTALNNLLAIADICRMKTSSLRRAVALLEISGPYEENLVSLGCTATGGVKCLDEEETPLGRIVRVHKIIEEQLQKRCGSSVLVLAKQGVVSVAGSETVGELLAAECNCHVLCTAVEPSSAGLWASPTDRIIGSTMALEALDIIEAGKVHRVVS